MINRSKKFTYKAQNMPMKFIELQTEVLKGKEYFTLDDIHTLDTLILELKVIKTVQPWYIHRADSLMSSLETLRLYKWESISK